MPLNEDALRKVFAIVAKKQFGWTLRLDVQDRYIGLGVEEMWQSFRAAYSPEVLQALGVVIQDQPLIARSLAEWHEDDGPVTWWAWCGHEWAGEPAWCGTPTDSDWPGYHTHWTPHPKAPAKAIASVKARQ